MTAHASNLDWLSELDVEYARFNASKTIGDPRNSEFEIIDVGPLLVTIDPMRDGSYYNRIIGLDTESLSSLDEALDRLAGRKSRIDVDERDVDRILPLLEAHTPVHRVTCPEFRSRGFHGSLIAARMAEAAARGVDRIVVDVEPRSASFRNHERAGFTVIQIETVWTREPGDLPRTGGA